MTFLEMQNRVMARLNWTSTESRDLVKFFLNERHRDVCSSVNLAPTRRTTVSVSTTSGSEFITYDAAKVLTVFDAVTLKRPLGETTVERIREHNSAEQVTGTPTHYAVYSVNSDSVTLMLYPKPSAVAALQADVIANGTDMSLDGDEPTFPADFHDILTRGALADGYVKIDKQPLADREERKFEQRLSDLRYFLVKSGWLHRHQEDRKADIGSHSHVWPYSNLG